MQKHDRNSSFCEDPTHRFRLISYNWNSLPELRTGTKIGYGVFIVQLMIQLSSMMWDFISDRSTESTSFVAIGIDILNIVLSVLILIGGTHLLWLVITILAMYHLIIALVQMVTLRLKYFKQIDNYLGVAMMILILLVLYLPKNTILNVRVFSIRPHSSIDIERCGIRRSVSGIIIILVWTRFLMALSKLQIFHKYNLYMILFFKVMQRYIKIMSWYGCYLLAYSFGFYIMLHDDIGPPNHVANITEVNSSAIKMKSLANTMENEKFDNPFLSFVKTVTMFVGEFDFGDIKIRGGDISVTMTHVFLLFFIFTMVIVLMNVLNGLAVSDTGKMLDDSLIESQASVINTIRNFESVYLGFAHMHHLRFLNPFLPKKLLLFHSAYLEDFKLSLPLKNKDLANWHNNGSCFQLFRLVTGKRDYWREELLSNARKVLRNQQICRVNDRRQNDLMKEVAEMKKMESYDEKIKRFENILRRSFTLRQTNHTFTD